MSNIGSVDRLGSQIIPNELRANTPAGPLAASAPATLQKEDRVELSEAANNQAAQPQAETVPDPKVALIRSQIAAGTYETPDKLDVVVDRLLELLKGE